MAELATGNREDALDLVQDAMMGLVKSYASRKEQEWAPLFYRILQSRIRDRYRRDRVRNRFRSWLGLGTRSDENGDLPDPIQNAPDTRQPDTIDKVLQEDAIDRLQDALLLLPVRQQQAFLLRCWEGMDVAATAFAMGCSEGSVKTHYSRAVHRLREMLEDHWP
jgi:RNA polymerase sigma-70 factor (ECF subfamily)